MLIIFSFANQKELQNALVILLNSEIGSNFNNTYCMISQKNGFVKRFRAIPTKLYAGEVECKIELFKLLCTGLPSIQDGDTTLIHFNNMYPVQVCKFVITSLEYLNS